MNKEIIERIKKNAYDKISPKKSKEVNFYIDTEPIIPVEPVEEIQLGYEKTPIDRNIIMVFMDEAPTQGWAHPCRYLLYDANNGEFLREIPSGFPPYHSKPEVPDSYVVFHEPIRLVEQKLYSIFQEKPRFLFRSPAEGNHYALLFSGEFDSHVRNDMEFLYRTLSYTYDFNPENIYILFCGGTLAERLSYPVDGSAYDFTSSIRGAGTKAEFENAIDDIKIHINEHDLLFIFTTGHGGIDENRNECFLGTYINDPSDRIYAYEFALKIQDLGSISKLTVMMQQCNGGGFEGPILGNSPAQLTSFTSASSYNETSGSGIRFHPFSLDYISALNGRDPYGHDIITTPDIYSNNEVSAKEAFNYAFAEDLTSATPQYGDYPDGSGNQISLGIL
ncbi:hypothetical protein ACFLZM_03090 [Thermodesulfobacteriota bacterium]